MRSRRIYAEKPSQRLPMLPTERIDRVAAHASEALVELERLKAELPSYAVESRRFLMAKVRVIGRSTGNERKMVVETAGIPRYAW